MLPNWLYGKSKSKLATILGGGGTPADYNEVKAQVTRLTQDSVTWDNLSEVGAVNMLPNIATTQTIKGVTFTVNSDGTITANGTATANAVLKISDRFTLADYIGRKYVDAKKNEASSSTYSLIITYRDGSGAYVNETYVPTEGFILSTISNATLVEFGVLVKSGQSVSNLTFKPMITASSYNGPYVPYAMSNRELTDNLTSDTNLGTAVNLSTYTAYSNMYTAPSDGYVHFQSAASGSTAITIYTYGNNTAAATDPHFTHSTSANNKAFEIFIKKGLKIYADGLQSGDTINFYPLT